MSGEEFVYFVLAILAIIGIGGLLAIGLIKLAMVIV